LVLLDQSHLPPTALKDLVPLLGNSKNLTAKLSAMKLDAATIDKLISGLEPMVKSGCLDMGALKIYATEHGLSALSKDKVPAKALGELLNAKTPADQKAVLAKYKVDADKVLKELHPYQELGLDRHTLGYYWSEQGTEVLAKYNVPRTALDDLVVALDDPAKLPGVIAQYGVTDVSAADKLRADLTFLKDEGFTKSDVSYYAAVEVNDILEKYGIPADAMQNAVELFNAGKLDELHNLAAEYGVDADGYRELNNTMNSLVAIGLEPTDILELGQEIQADVSDLGQAIDEPVDDADNSEVLANNDEPAPGGNEESSGSDDGGDGGD
jgi:hypothetical protein